MVNQAPLVVVGVLGPGVPAQDAPRDLEHVVRVAGLRGPRADVLGELAVGREVLGVAVAAGHVAPLVYDRVPEERGDGPPRLIAGQLVLPGGAEDLGKLRVGVQPGELVLAPRERIEHGVVVEPLRELQVLLLAGHGGQLGQHVVHAAVLVAEHLLHLLVAELVGPRLDPVARLLQDLQRLLVAAQHVHVQQAGVDLVQRVPGRPDLLARLDAVDELLGIRAQVAAGELGLAPGQPGHDGVGPLLEPLVAGAGEHHGAGGQVMAEAVSAHLALGLLPSTQRLGLRRQPGVETEGVQQPVGLQRQQVLAVQLHGVLKRPVQQPHLVQLEGLDPARHDLADFAGSRKGEQASGQHNEQAAGRRHSESMEEHLGSLHMLVVFGLPAARRDTGRFASATWSRRAGGVPHRESYHHEVGHATGHCARKCRFCASPHGPQVGSTGTRSLRVQRFASLFHGSASPSFFSQYEMYRASSALNVEAAGNGPSPNTRVNAVTA